MNQTLSLEIVVKGEVVQSNLVEFRAAVQARLAEINLTPQTDDEFAQADADAKMLKSTEDAVKKAQDKALADAGELNALLTALSDASDEIRQARLKLERTLKTERERRVKNLVDEWQEKLICAPANKQKLRGDLEQCTKAKRTIASMEAALENFVTATNEKIRECVAMLDAFEKEHGGSMTHDRAHLEMSTPNVVQYQLDARLKQKQLEDERKQAQAEALREREAREKLEREQAAPTPHAPATPEKSSTLGESPFANATWHDQPKSQEESVVKDSLTAPSAQEEAAAFLATLQSAFAPIKSARATLTHEKNQQAVAHFADALSAAFKQLKNELA